MTAFLAEARNAVTAQRRAMDAALDRFAVDAPDDCQLAKDRRTLSLRGRRTSARNVIYHRGWRLAYLMATNVGDHVAAVGDVASATSPRAFAHMTLARAALEGAARVNYLLYPTGTVEDRVLRAAALALSSAEEEVKATTELATGSPLLFGSASTTARQRREELLGLLERADIVVRRTRRTGELSELAWREGSHDAAQTNPRVTALLRELLPSKPAAYRMGSGATHSQPWALEDDNAFDPRTRRLAWRLDPSALAASVDLAIAASILTLEPFAAMLGQDTRDERTESRRREQAVARLAATAMSR